MKYDDLTHRFAKWLFPIIERTDCGYENANGEPRPHHTDRVLESRDLPFPPRQVTRTDLYGHLHVDEVLFYRSRHRSGFALAMIDIDAKRGQTDAQTVADWLIATYLPHAYCEPSRGGKGRHVYALFRVGQVPAPTVNAALAATGKALRTLALHEGFNANVDDVFGTFTLWSKGEGRWPCVERRGRMGKVPRLPHGFTSLDRLVSAPVFLPCALLPVIADAEKLSTASLSSLTGTKVSTSESSSGGSELASVCSPPRTKVSTSESADPAKLKALRLRAVETANPLARMRRASSLFYHQHGRYADDEDELVAFYEGSGLHTDEDKHDRRGERARIALDRHRLTERRRTTRRYSEADYLPMIRQNVTHAVRTQPEIKYRYAVGNDLLAAALYAYTKAAFAKNRTDRMHSLSDAGLVAMLKVLSESGAVTSKFGDKEKRVAVRQMLQLARLIVLRDGEHVHGGREHGVGDKWGIGPNHARFAEFVGTFQDIVDPRCLSLIREARLSA